MKCNLLMALMQLDIGGAETHVVELSKELSKRGYNIIIASNGGAYVEELEKSGIKHYKLPLHSKKPKDMLTSKKELKRIIKEEKIDLVHSHARIPSFILGRLHKSMKFPFVTTAHWVFNTKHGLKYLTNWGEKTIAVSEDIKKYLMDNYHTPEENIFVTINGIDTEKFSPQTDKKKICDEFNINENDNTIVYISRMDEDRSLVAKQLINVIPKLDGIVENLKVLVVGGGNDFENVSALAEKTNEILNRKAIIMTGPRTDINKLIAPAKLFVGVSRSALEAMAEKKPVIIAGNEGYIGLFDESKLQVGIDTNFCCRGCEESTEERLAQEIGEFFGMWDEDIEKISEYGRNMIINNYSVTRMADDAEKAYTACLKNYNK
ncbi:MAG: glycosyltransferase [Clostridia bacterium]|nr:glycosyltransferase [Clostridia bacterium]